MKAKIDRAGILWIERVGRMVLQTCKFSNEEWCEHECPHFGDISREDGYPDTLPICHGTVITGEIVDERVPAPVDRADSNEGSGS